MPENLRKKLMFLVMWERRFPNYLLKRLPFCEDPSDDEESIIRGVFDLDNMALASDICTAVLWTALMMIYVLYGIVVPAEITTWRFLLVLVFLPIYLIISIAVSFIVTLCSIAVKRKAIDRFNDIHKLD